MPSAGAPPKQSCAPPAERITGLSAEISTAVAADKSVGISAEPHCASVVALLAIASWVGFYAGTLEEFYTGELYLGYINMPNEGLLLSSLIHLSGAVVPPAFWTARVAALRRVVAAASSLCAYR